MTTSAQTAQAPPKYKRSIKNYLLDARFQLKWTGFIIMVALAVSAIILITLTWSLQTAIHFTVRMLWHAAEVTR